MADALREILARFGFEVDSSKLVEANKSVDATKSSIANLGKVIAGGIIYSKLKDFVTDLRETGTELRTTSLKLGMNAQEWQRWKYVAGGASEELAVGIRFLQKNATEAAEKGGEAGNTFKKLGIDVKDSSGHVKDTSTLLRETGFGIAAIKNPAERAAAAMKVFGRSGTSLLPIFAKGKDGVAALLKEFDDLGGGLSDEALDVLKESGKAANRFDLAILGVKGQLAVELFPALTTLVGYGTKAVVMFQKMTAGTNFFKAAMVVLGLVAGKAALSMLAPWLPAIAIFSAIILVVDDLITAMRGGTSVIGTIIDRLFGVGTTKSIFGRVSKDLDEFLEMTKGASVVKQVIAVFQAAFEGLASDIPMWLGQANDAVKDWTDENIMFPLGQLGAEILDWLDANDPFDLIYDSFADVLGQIGDLGASIVDGFVAGLTGAWHKVEEFWENSGGALIKKIEGIFKIGSPSKVLSKIGFHLPEGQAQGMAKGLHLVERQRDAMTDASIPSQYAPPSSSISNRNQNVQMTQHNRINQEFHSPGAAAMGGQMRDSVLGITYDDRRAMIADLETLGVPA